MINIVYEDNHLLIVEKTINVPVQGDSSNDLDFLTILKQFIKKRDNKPGNVYLGLVHRLDRPVGGIMVFAKTSKCAARLSKQVQNHDFKKTYFAVVMHKIIKKCDTFIDYLLKDEKKNIVKIDKSILWDAENSERGQIILESCVHMIKQMKRKILVEGVETRKQVEKLEKLGVDYLQGYYFSKPITKREILAYGK